MKLEDFIHYRIKFYEEHVPSTDHEKGYERALLDIRNAYFPTKD